MSVRKTESILHRLAADLVLLFRVHDSDCLNETSVVVGLELTFPLKPKLKTCPLALPHWRRPKLRSPVESLRPAVLARVNPHREEEGIDPAPQ